MQRHSNEDINLTWMLHHLTIDLSSSSHSDFVAQVSGIASRKDDRSSCNDAADGELETVVLGGGEEQVCFS